MSDRPSRYSLSLSFCLDFQVSRLFVCRMSRAYFALLPIVIIINTSACILPNITYFAIITLPSSCNRSQAKKISTSTPLQKPKSTNSVQTYTPHTVMSRVHRYNDIKGLAVLALFFLNLITIIIWLNFDTLFLVWLVGRYLKTAKCSFISFHSLPPPLHTISPQKTCQHPIFHWLSIFHHHNIADELEKPEMMMNLKRKIYIL